MAITGTTVGARSPLNDRVFFTGMAVVFVLIDAVGFIHEFLKTQTLQRQWLSDWTKVHAVCFTLWIFLFLAQASLVALNRIDLHRRLGIAGAALAATMIGLTLGSSAWGFAHSEGLTALETFMRNVVVHVDGIDFAILAIAGLLMRNRDSEAHKRLMFLATVAVAIRFPFLGGVLFHSTTKIPHYIDQDLFVLALILFDLVRYRRVHRALIAGGLVIALLPPIADISFRTLVPQLVVKPLG